MQEKPKFYINIMFASRVIGEKQEGWAKSAPPPASTARVKSNEKMLKRFTYASTVLSSGAGYSNVGPGGQQDGSLVVPMKDEAPPEGEGARRLVAMLPRRFKMPVADEFVRFSFQHYVLKEKRHSLSI